MLHALHGRAARPRAGFTTLSLLLCVAFAVAVPGHAEAGSLPDQGVYDTCEPTRSPDYCESRLRRLSDGGFKVVVGFVPQVAAVPAALAYADAARRQGVKVIWQLKSSLSDAELQDIISALRVHTSTRGYYIWDEPSQADRDEVAAFAARVKALDPHHERIVMGCGNCYGGEKSVAFMADIDATLGTDIYPVWEQGPDQPIVGRKVHAAAAGLRKVADRAGRKTVVALQAFRWGDSHYDSESTGIGQASRFPTRREVEAQRNAAIEGGHPDLILWFTLNQVIGWEPGQRPWYWAEPSDTARRWANLVGGAFAPMPSARRAASRRPVARFTLRVRRLRQSGARAARSSALRITFNGARSSSTNGRIVRFRWYASGRRTPVCSRRRCTVNVPATRRGHRTLKLVVTDNRGAQASQARRLPRYR